MAASKLTDIHTRMHMHNRVPLVWGSFSLAPIMVFTIIKNAIKAVISIGTVPTCMYNVDDSICGTIREPTCPSEFSPIVER